jgi:CRP-like cAMP-binding protein
MNDQLKQFIEDNRDEFDSEHPDPALFARLQKGISQERKSRLPIGLLRRFAAAAAVLVAVASIYLMLRKNERPASPGPGNTMETTGFPDPAYAQQIEQYKTVISLQQTQLRQVANDHPELYRQFTEDITQLDSAYRALKATLDTNPNTEVLLEAMIRNLQLQTELLNRQLVIIKEIKQKSKT